MVRACQASAKQKGYGGIEAIAVLAEANILCVTGGVRGAGGHRVH